MRKHIFYLIAAGLLAFSFSSCSKNGECDPEDKESPCYAGPGPDAKLLLTEQRINGEAFKFEYDDKNRRTRYILTSGTIEYSYNAKGYLSAVINKDPSGKIMERDDYTYGSDEKPISSVMSNPNDKDDIPVDVQYTYSKNKIIATFIPRRDNGANSTNTFLFNDQGNLTAIITSMGGMESTTSLSEFDNKPSAAINGDPFYWKNAKNNAQRFQVTSPIYNLDQKWVYTYNSQGYPTKALVYNNGSKEVAEEHIFTYKAAK